jgi:hypothetical protein
MFSAFSFKETGSALIQSMVAGALLIAGSAYVMNANNTGNKVLKTAERLNNNNVLAKEISDVLSVPEICAQTMNKDGQWTTGPRTLSGIYQTDGSLMLGPGSESAGKKIESFIVKGYTEAPGMNMTAVTLEVMANANFQPGIKHKSFGGDRSKIEIPLTLVTQDNVVQSCMTDSAADMALAYKQACTSLGGEIDPGTNRCIKLHGPQGALLRFIDKSLCAGTDDGCVHPYANFKCSGGPNHVMNGFNETGTPQCVCVPVLCNNPAQYCTGTDLGTDQCGNDCPVGNNPSMCSIELKNPNLFLVQFEESWA